MARHLWRGDLPEKAPGAGGVNAAPSLNLEGGSRPGRGLALPSGLGTREAGQGGQGVEDNLRGASPGAEGEGKARPEVPRELTARTHVRTQRRAHWDLRALGLRGRGGGGGAGSARSPCGALRRRCAGRGGGAARQKGVGRCASQGRGWVQDAKS